MEEITNSRIKTYRFSNYQFIYLVFSIILIISGFLNIILLINIGSYNLRLSYLIVFIFCILNIALYSLNYNIKFIVPYSKFFMVFILIYFLSTLINFNSKYFERGIFDCFLMTLNFLHYLFIVNLLVSENYFDSLFKIYIYIAGILSFIAILLILLKLAGVDIPFFSHYKVGSFIYTEDISLFPRLKFLDPVSGGFLATVSLIGFCYWFLERSKNTFFILLSSILSFIAMILSFARGPIVGFLVGFLLFICINIARGKISKFFLKKIFIFILIFIIFFQIIYIIPGVGDIVFGKIKNLLNIEVGTGAHRISWWKQMFIDFLNKPFLGYGASNYRKFREIGSFVGVSENIYVEILHSSGLLGFTILLVMNFLFIIGALKKIFLKNRKEIFLVSFLCGYICLCTIAFTNPIAWSSFFWITLAFFVASLKGIKG